MAPPPVEKKPHPLRSSARNGERKNHQVEDGNEPEKMNEDRWNQQRSRIDGLLSTLKQEMQEVKSMDKNLTRQFIQLGGKIQKLKEVEKQYFEQLSLQGQGFFEEEEDVVVANENGISTTVGHDTRF